MERLIKILCHIFGVVKVPAWQVQYLKDYPAKRGSSQVVLEPLEQEVGDVMNEHLRSVLDAASRHEILKRLIFSYFM
jgi:hypothetical protein